MYKNLDNVHKMPKLKKQNNNEIKTKKFFLKPFQYLFERFLQHFVQFVIVVVEILMLYDDYHSNYSLPLIHLYVINKKKLIHYDMLHVK